MRAILFFVLIVLFILPEELEARRRSRGGGLFRRKAPKFRKVRKPVKRVPSRSRARKLWKTGGKSSRTNVHQKHARKAGKKGTKYRSRSEALQAYKKSKEFRQLPNTFTSKPKKRPDYIPKAIVRDNRSVNVVFINNSYGYYHGTRFVPLGYNDYYVNDHRLYNSHYGYRTSHYRSSSSGGVLLLFCMILFMAFVIFLIYIFIQSSKKRAQSQANIISEPDPPQHEDLLLNKLYNKKKGDLINLSDPNTLGEFGKAVDFTVTHINSYKHDTFNLQEIGLLNDVDSKEPIQNHFFIKEVDGDYALYMGILDHEGNNEDLEQEQWYHLDETGEQFAEEFHSVFIDKNDAEFQVTFSQLGVGAFYDVELHGEPVAVCEYQPQDDCDYEYAIVIWQGDWISCFYCHEIHKHNFDAF